MIKLSANVSKKLPVPGLEYSSRSFSAGVEIEVAETTDPDQIREKLAVLYTMLEKAVDKQLERETGEPPVTNGPDRKDAATHKRNDRDNGRMATEAQVKAIKAIARDHHLGRTDLADLVDREFGLAELDRLSLQQASRLIDVLKDNGKEA